MNDIFKFVGMATVIVVAVFSVYGIVWGLKEAITKAKWNYKYRHRFSKPPTAKCYCHDCRKWNPDTGKCYDSCNSRYMADNWFCYFAEPKDKETVT